MKITNIGGATAILEHGDRRILFDPWMNEGIFHGSWYHYPPLQIQLKDLGRFDYIYISHIHEDHCAPGTIEYLNRDAEIILMDRQPNLVEKFLHTYRFKFKKIHLVKPRTPIELEPGLVVDMLEADPAHVLNHIIDSALIINWDNIVIYNANDCPPYPDGLTYIKTTYKKVDLALLPYAGGSGYPACYGNLSHEEKLQEKQRIYQQNLQNFVQTIQTLNPNYVMPFADQYIIAGSRSHLNPYLSHPPCPGAVIPILQEHGLENHLLLLNSGQSFDVISHRKSPDTPYQVYSETERDEYIQANLSDKRYDYETFPLNPNVSIERLIHQSRTRLWDAQIRLQYFPNFSYYVDVLDRQRRFQINLNREDAEEVPWQVSLNEPYLKISLGFNLLVYILIGHISWNIADAALFLDYDRQPNQYQPEIYSLLNYFRI